MAKYFCAEKLQEIVALGMRVMGGRSYFEFEDMSRYYREAPLTLYAGGAPLTLHYVQVLTEPLDAAAIDDTYGILGMDALEELKSYTFDYRTMRFGVKNE